MATFFIAAGGTGGHIYPGLALAEALREVEPDSQIYFVGTPQGLENKILRERNETLLHLKIGRLNKNIPRWERVKTFLQLPLSFLTSLILLWRYKPDAVIGVGGHASGPIVLVASLLDTPTVIWEPNAMPGMANRLLARFVDLACIVFEDSKLYLKAPRFQQVGLPLRAEIEKFANQAPVVSNEHFRLLVFGGSQGAHGLNRIMTEFLTSDPHWLDKNEVLHQTGPVEFEKVKVLYGSLLSHPHLQVVPYIDDMAQAYIWSDAVICRAGTGTLAELAAIGKPSLLVPFPFASDNHQQKNAEAFVREESALMILQKDLTLDLFRETLLKLSQDESLREKLSKHSRKFYRPNAAKKMAVEVLALAKEKKRK